MAKQGAKELADRKQREAQLARWEQTAKESPTALALPSPPVKARTAAVVLDRQVALPTRSLPETELAIADAQLQRIRELDQQREKINQRYWFEVKDFHTNKRWIIKGYATFEECCATELGYSKRHLYRLLEAADVRDSIDSLAKSDPGSLLPNIDAMTERQARELKRLPLAARVDVAKEVDFTIASTADVRQAVAAKITPTPQTTTVTEAEVIIAANPLYPTSGAAQEDDTLARDVVYPDTQPNEWPNRLPVVVDAIDTDILGRHECPLCHTWH